MLKISKFKCLLSLLILFLCGCSPETQSQGMASAEAKTALQHFSVQKTEAEWKQLLPEQTFDVMRKQGTERAFSGKYDNNKEDGIYFCAACGNHLYDAKHKYDSGTGWPSFYKPLESARIGTKDDYGLLGSKRTEVHCARCGGHLGHVFNDGPKPTGLRYCMNSVALNFRKRNEIAPPLLK
jgi:peptide-methionine (R)-S-oxide reductase